MLPMKEFVLSDDKILVNVPYAEAYIPRELFNDDDETKSSICVQYADGFKVVGMFNMRFYESEDVPRESTKLRTFSFPNMIMTYPTDFTVEKLNLSANEDGEEPYLILKYYMGDVIMASEDVQSPANCTKFLNMITKGKIPSTIPYDKFESIWQMNFQINRFNPQVPSVVLQMIWAEMCRDPNDLTKPYRMLYGKGDVSPIGYVETNMNNVAAATSVFSALSFERVTEKLAASLNMTKSGIEQRRSPVEEVLTM